MRLFSLEDLSHVHVRWPMGKTGVHPTLGPWQGRPYDWQAAEGDTLTRPDTTTVHDDAPADDAEEHAHIVAGKDDVTAAYINGTPITALCGYTWVPSKNPENKPVCPRCKYIYGDVEKLS